MSTQPPSRKRGKAGGSGGDERGRKKPRKNPAPRRLSAEEANNLGEQLYSACRSGETAEAKRLIGEGAPVDWQDGDGWATLHWASNNGRTEIVMLLLENKCNLNVTDRYGNTPLIEAALSNEMDCARILVEAGCDVTIRDNKNKTAAEWAEQNGHHDIEEYLCGEWDSDEWESDESDEWESDESDEWESDEWDEWDEWELGYELWDACDAGRTARAKRLIAKGAPVDWQDDPYGRAPLHAASVNGATEIVMLLLENKCNPNVTSKKGDTPLIEAALSNEMDCARALVEAGCDITIRNKKGKTAAERANRDKGTGPIAEYLRGIRFLPSGRATRAIERDLKETGLLPAGPLSIIKEFATGKR